MTVKKNDQTSMFTDEEMGVRQDIARTPSEHWGIFPEHEMCVQIKGFPKDVKPFLSQNLLS